MNETSTSIHSQSHSWENFKKFQLPPCHRNSTSWSHQQGCLDIYWWWFVVVYGCAVFFSPLTPDDEAKTPKAWQTFMTFCCIGPPAPCQAAVSWALQNWSFWRFKSWFSCGKVLYIPSLLPGRLTSTFPFWFLQFLLGSSMMTPISISSLSPDIAMTSTAWFFIGDPAWK